MQKSLFGHRDKNILKAAFSDSLSAVRYFIKTDPKCIKETNGVGRGLKGLTARSMAP